MSMKSPTETAARIIQGVYGGQTESANAVASAVIAFYRQAQAEQLGWEYRVFDADGELWAGSNDLAEAKRYLVQEPDGRIERAHWEPVEVTDAH